MEARKTQHVGGRFRSAVLMVALVAAASAYAPGSASAVSGCHRVAAPTGNDGAAGTEAAPFRTFKKLSSALQPGQFGCLRGGVYDEDPTIRVSGTASAPITITSYPGEWATLYGRLSVEDNAMYVVIQHMTLDGAGAPNDGSSKLPSPTVHGDKVAFVSNEVTNRNTAICFAIGNESYGRAYDVAIVGNRIHNCGVLPPTNHQHGIYLHSPSGAQVTDNWIHDNADTGVNLFPNADGHYFARNVIHGNGDNISFAGRSKNGACESSDNNLVENNVLSYPRVRKNITSWSSCGIDGIGNVLRRNCIYPATFEGDGYALEGNLHVAPSYVDPANADFRIVAGTPCAALVDHPDPAIGQLPVPGLRPVAPPIGERFGLRGQPAAGPASGSGGPRSVTLRALRRFVRPGGRIVLEGRVSVPGRRKVRIMVRRRGGWARARAVVQGGDGRFRTRLRLRRVARKAAGGRTPLVLHRLSLPRRVARIVLRAQVPGVGRSNRVRVRVRR